MADNRLLEDHYLETNYRGLEDKCIEPPLPIALIVMLNSSKMRYIFTQLTFLFFLNVGWSQPGQFLYETKCLMCHNKVEATEPLTGPLLGGITDKVDRSWLLAYTKNSLDMLDKGDFRALCLWEHWKPCVMPSYTDSLSNEQIEDIYDYIEQVSKKNNLQYYLACDSNKTLSAYYFDSLEQKLISKWGLKKLNGSFIGTYPGGPTTTKVKIVGTFAEFQFYLIHKTRKELIPLITDGLESTKQQFDLGLLEIDTGQNYLIVIVQGDYNEFEIGKFILHNTDNKQFSIEMNPKQSIKEVVKSTELN